MNSHLGAISEYIFWGTVYVVTCFVISSFLEEYRLKMMPNNVRLQMVYEYNYDENGTLIDTQEIMDYDNVIGAFVVGY